MLDVNLTGATMTGVCLADCNVKGYTLLDDIVCDYVFKEIDLNNQFGQRIPEPAAEKFKPGEFGQWLHHKMSGLP